MRLAPVAESFIWECINVWSHSIMQHFTKP